MTAHFELTDDTINHLGVTLYRIRATRDLPQHGVRTGDLGGWVRKIENLCTCGNPACLPWVSQKALVYGSALVSGSARVSGSAEVSGSALVYGSARVYGSAEVSDSQDILTLGPIGSENMTATLTRAPKTEAGHILTVGCWQGGTIDQLMTEVDERAKSWGGTRADRARWRAEYETLVPLLRLRAAGWTEDAR